VGSSRRAPTRAASAFANSSSEYDDLARACSVTKIRRSSRWSLRGRSCGLTLQRHQTYDLSVLLGRPMALVESASNAAKKQMRERLARRAPRSRAHG